jgi:hypothetical protein
VAETDQALLRASGAVFEAPAFVAGLDDVAVVGEAVEERRGHLGVAEDGRPFTEGEVGGDDDGGLLVETADEVEEQLTTGLGEGKVAEFIENDEVQAAEVVGNAACRPARASASSLLTRSMTLKNRPRAPPRMQARAMPTARWVLPVPEPPTRTRLRCWARKPPPARSRTRVSLI